MQGLSYLFCCTTLFNEVFRFLKQVTMTGGEARVKDLQESNLDDLIYVCSSKKLSDPVHMKGVALKKAWLKKMLERYGPLAKIAYLDEKPVAQILFHPEEASPTSILRRRGVIHLDCIYNATPEARQLGIASKLLQSLVEDCRQGKGCLQGTPCRFIVARAFNTGEALSLSQFYTRRGFKPSPTESGIMYLPISEPYQPEPSQGEYESLPEDKGRAIVFYNPACEFFYPFALRIAESIEEIAPSVPIELVNEWIRPEESIKRKGCTIIVNARPIKTFFMDKENFQREVREASEQRDYSK
jgi:GNAT superfamily N-acetyltransferase